MFQGELFYYICGAAFAFFGYSYLEERKRYSENLGSKIFIIPLALLFIYDHGKELWMSGDRLYQAVALLSIFCVVSPLAGLFWYGRGGYFRRLFFSFLGFLALWAFSAVILSALFGKVHSVYVGISGLMITGCVFAFPGLKKRWMRWKRKRETEKNKRLYEQSRQLGKREKAEQKRRDEAIFEQIIEEMKR